MLEMETAHQSDFRMENQSKFIFQFIRNKKIYFLILSKNNCIQQKQFLRITFTSTCFSFSSIIFSVFFFSLLFFSLLSFLYMSSLRFVWIKAVRFSQIWCFLCLQRVHFNVWVLQRRRTQESQWREEASRVSQNCSSHWRNSPWNILSKRISWALGISWWKVNLRNI